MKTLLLLSSLLLTTAASARPLAFLKQSGGFCPGTCPSSSLTIEDNGTVYVEIQKYVPTPSVERKVLLRLGKDLTNALQKDIQSIAIAELIDTNEGAPICADAPEFLFTVVKGNQKIDIARDLDCHKYILANFQGTQIVDMLRSFLTLHYYSQF